MIVDKYLTPIWRPQYLKSKSLVVMSMRIEMRTFGEDTRIIDHSFNQHRRRVHSGPGSGLLSLHARGFPDVSDGVSRQERQHEFRNLFQSVLTSASEGKSLCELPREGKWQMTQEGLPRLFCVPLKSRRCLGDSLHLMESIGPGSGPCGCPKGPEHDCRISFPVVF